MTILDTPQIKFGGKKEGGAYQKPPLFQAP
jgi:hypothetical protein